MNSLIEIMLHKCYLGSGVPIATDQVRARMSGIMVEIIRGKPVNSSSIRFAWRVNIYIFLHY
jgi:hypothetical protein